MGVLFTNAPKKETKNFNFNAKLYDLDGEQKGVERRVAFWMTLILSGTRFRNAERFLLLLSFFIVHHSIMANNFHVRSLKWGFFSRRWTSTSSWIFSCGRSGFLQAAYSGNEPLAFHGRAFCEFKCCRVAKSHFLLPKGTVTYCIVRLKSF